MPIKPALATALAIGAILVPSTSAGPPVVPDIRFPAAGELLVQAASVVARPDAKARVVREVHQHRSNGQLQTLLALRAHREGGHTWYELSLPGRPNNQRGWIDADLIDVHAVANRITIHRAARTIEVRTVATGRLLARATVAVGAPSSPTPLGRNFYVTEGYFPADPFYGTYALATSAYSRLTDWPGGGVVGIHGTNRPDLLGQAVSHGCIRVGNETAERLERFAPPGTPIDIVP